MKIYYAVADTHGCSDLMEKAYKRIFRDVSERNLKPEDFQIIWSHDLCFHPEEYDYLDLPDKEGT